MAKHFISICLATLEYVLLLEKKLSQSCRTKILVPWQYYWEYESWNKVPQSEPMNMVSKHTINSTSAMDAVMTDCFALFHEIAPSKKEKVVKHGSSCINTSDKVWICISSHLKMIRSFKSEYMILGSMQVSENFLCSFLVIQSWITLIHTQHSNNKSDVWPSASLSTH